MLISILVFVLLNKYEANIINFMRPRFKNFNYFVAKFGIMIVSLVIYAGGLCYAYFTLPNTPYLPTSQFVFYFTGASAGLFYASFIWPMVHDYLDPNCGLIAHHLT